MMKRKFLIFLAYVILFLVLTLIFTYLRFPIDKVKQWLIGLVESRFSVSLSISSLRRHFFGGVRALDVRIAQKGDFPLYIRFDQVDLDISLLHWIRGRYDVDFTAFNGEGFVSGSLKSGQGETKDAYELTLHLNQFPLASLTTFKDRYALELSGEASGSVSLMLYFSHPDQNTGEIELEMTHVSAGGNPPMIGAILKEGEALQIGNMSLKANLQGQTLNVEKCSSDGDLGADITGTIAPFQPQSLLKSRLNLNANVKLSGNLQQMDALITSMTRKRKNPDGFYTWKISGSLERPDVR